MSFNKALVFSIVLLIVLTFYPAITVGQSSTPGTVDLGETIFVYGHYQFDRDSDGLKDSLEAMLAERFKPIIYFDSDEGSRRSNEPVILFQVRPFGCMGKGCGQPSIICIKYIMLFARDGGWGPNASCTTDDHNGDIERIMIHLKSTEEQDGRKWTPYYLQMASEDFLWPENTQVAWEYTNPIVFMSAHHHHQYPHTGNDHENSIYTSYGCNDDVNGMGARIAPDLRRPGHEGQYNNVGEPWPPSAHDRKYFVNELDAYGYPGENAWNPAKHFFGGYGDGDAVLMSPLTEFWDDHRFYYGEGFQDSYRVLAHLKGSVINQVKQPIKNVFLYFRNIKDIGPWGTIPVDRNGQYSVKLEDGTYLLRAVAPGYKFKNVPYEIRALKGIITNANPIIGEFSLRVPTDGQAKGSSKSRTEKTGLKRITAESITSKKDRQYALGRLNTDGGINLSGPPIKMRTMDMRGLYFNAPPVSMAAFDEIAEDKGKNMIDPVLKLKRRSTIRVQLVSLLRKDKTPAKRKEEVAIIKKELYGKINTEKNKSFNKMLTGKPVKGAKILARFVPESGLLYQESPGWVEAITDTNGNAYWTIHTGTKPGKAKVEAMVVYNPVNTWYKPTLESHFIEIQPGIHGNDFVQGPKIKLVKGTLVTGEKNGTLRKMIKYKAGVKKKKRPE